MRLHSPLLLVPLVIAATALAGCGKKSDKKVAAGSSSPSPSGSAPKHDPADAKAGEIIGWVDRPARSFDGMLESEAFSLTLVEGFAAVEKTTAFRPSFELATADAPKGLLDWRLRIELGKSMQASAGSDMKEMKRDTAPDGTEAVWYEHTQSIVGDFRQGLLVQVSYPAPPREDGTPGRPYTCEASILGEGAGPVALANKERLNPFLAKLCRSLVIKK